MTILGIVKACLSFDLVGLIVYMLICYASAYNAVYRLGHGMTGTAMFVSAFKQLGFAYLVAPFDPTYQLL